MCKLSICNMIYHKYSPDAPLSIMLNGIYVNIMLKSEMFLDKTMVILDKKKWSTHLCFPSSIIFHKPCQLT